jgi:hypothetical protein
VTEGCAGQTAHAAALCCACAADARDAAPEELSTSAHIGAFGSACVEKGTATHARINDAWTKREMDTLGIEPRASRMLSGCDTTTPRALCSGERKNANGATVACRLLSPGLLSSNFKRAKGWRCQRVYGATVARLTPDQKVGSSNLSALILSRIASSARGGGMRNRRGAAARHFSEKASAAGAQDAK